MINTSAKTNYLFLLLCLWFFTPLTYANGSSSEQTLLELSVLPIILLTSPAIIDNEIAKLEGQNIKLKKKQREQLRHDLLARFHGKELERQILQALRNNPKLDNQDILALSRSSQQPSLQALLELHRSTLNKPPRQALLDYYQKIEQQPPQPHRLSLIRAFDGLEKQSHWQAALVHHIQTAIFDSLNQHKENKRATHYQIAGINKQRELLSNYNHILLLYAFRQTPSLDIVPYLDTLNKPENKRLFEALDLAFTRVLDHRTNMALIVDP